MVLRKSFQKNESEVSKKEYTVTLTHTEIRSLIQWMPKNYDSDDEVRLGIEHALNDAEEIEYAK